MKFHNFKTMFDAVKQKTNLTYSQFYRNMNHNLHPLRNRGEEYSLLYSKSIAELKWHESLKPYYKVWPSILFAFQRFKLDVPALVLDPKHESMLIRFAYGHEPKLPVFGHKLLCILARSVVVNGRKRLWLVWRLDDGDGLKDTSDGSFCIDLTERSLEDLVCKEYEKFNDAEDGKLVLRIASTMFLLEDDPAIIQPDVLRDDLVRFDKSDDPAVRQRLINKARKRGIVGFRVGEQYETIPHYRRPHPALYHVGKGRKEQRIVFRSGCVVHRDKMTKVPTGYITPEGVEVEP